MLPQCTVLQAILLAEYLQPMLAWDQFCRVIKLHSFGNSNSRCCSPLPCKQSLWPSSCSRCWPGTLSHVLHVLLREVHCLICTLHTAGVAGSITTCSAAILAVYVSQFPWKFDRHCCFPLSCRPYRWLSSCSRCWPGTLSSGRQQQSCCSTLTSSHCWRTHHMLHLSSSSSNSRKTQQQTVIAEDAVSLRRNWQQMKQQQLAVQVSGEGSCCVRESEIVSRVRGGTTLPGCSSCDCKSVNHNSDIG